MNEKSKYEDALLNPTGVYDHPRGVVCDSTLDASQKLAILKNWEAEATHLQESEAEGFSGGENSLLADIKQAVIELSASK